RRHSPRCSRTTSRSGNPIRDDQLAARNRPRLRRKQARPSRNGCEEGGVMRGKGRIYRPKNRNVWMLDYFAPPLSGGFERIRESAETDDEKTAKKRLETRLRQVRNAQDGISDF